MQAMRTRTSLVEESVDDGEDPGRVGDGAEQVLEQEVVPHEERVLPVRQLRQHRRLQHHFISYHIANNRDSMQCHSGRGAHYTTQHRRTGSNEEKGAGEEKATAAYGEGS